MKKQQPSKKIKTKNYQRLSFLALFLAFALILGSLIGNDKDSDKAGLASKSSTDHSTDTSHSTEVRICEAPCILSFNPSRWTPPQGVTQPDDVGREIARSLGMTGEGWSEGVMSICRREFSESVYDVMRCRLSFVTISGIGDRNKDTDKAGFSSKTTTHSTEVSTEVPTCQAPCIRHLDPSDPFQWQQLREITQPDDVGREIARSLGMTGEGWSEGVMSICRREFSESADVTGCYLSFFNIALEGACVGGQSPSDVAWNTLQANGIEDRNAYSGTEETQRCLNARRDCQEACGSIPDGELLNTCLTRLKTINPACG